MPADVQRLTIAQIMQMYPEEATPSSDWVRDWVRYSDYENLEAERDALATGKLPSDHSLIRAEQAEAERDEAAQRERERLREALKANATEIASCRSLFGAEQLIDQILAGPGGGAA